jgi:uncharacterized protein YrzB (UPF0473 family)
MSEEFGSDFIVLTDEEGNEFELEHLDTLEHDGVTYMAFTPVKEEEADAAAEGEEIEIVILKVEEEDGEEILVTVDDEDMLDHVYELFMQRMEDAEQDDEIED